MKANVTPWPSLLRETEPYIREAGLYAVKNRPNLQRTIKPDGSIVTNLDKEVETTLREQLLAMTPGAGFWGEEFGYSPATDEGFWLLDPIDGTSNFAFGQPLWGVTVAFFHSGKIRFGATFLPDLDLMLTAADQNGAHLNGQPLPPIPTGEITSVELVAIGDSHVRIQKISPGKMRHLGAFCVEAVFTATQRVRAMTTGHINLYDCAGGIVAARELGAEIRHVNGDPFDENQWITAKKAHPFYIGPAESNFPFGSPF